MRSLLPWRRKASARQRSIRKPSFRPTVEFAQEHAQRVVEQPVAQDVGGAIKGSNRFDTFWGGGPDATNIAGGMSASGQALILLPKGVASRAIAQP